MLLMADRQTTGGYARLATVISADIGLAGQLAPGDSISFVVCSRREAMAALIAEERLLMAAEAPQS
jgi:antagonist of KipI